MQTTCRLLTFSFLTVLLGYTYAMEKRPDTPRPSRKSAHEILSSAQKEAAQNIAASEMLIEDCLAQELGEKKDALGIAEEALAQAVKEKRRQSKLIAAGVEMDKTLEEKREKLTLAQAAVDATMKTKKEEVQDI